MFWYPLMTLGYGKRLGVWFQGCKRRCDNCISPEFQAMEGGSLLTPEQILNRIPEGAEVDGLTVSGGEPFDQPEALLALMLRFVERYGDDIVIFTGYTLAELKNMKTESVNRILELSAVLVDGIYIDSMNDGRGMRGSSNQKITVQKHLERYTDVDICERKLQGIFIQDRLWMLGIPPQ